MNTRLALLAGIVLSACAARQEVTGERDPRHRLPDPDVVTSAVRRLGQAVRDELQPWPSHLPRSRDFPELPLVRVEQVEDLGRTGADTDALTRTLEHELRRQRLLRLSIDEEAVPTWLREEPPSIPRQEPAGPPRPAADEPTKPGLRLKAWTDRVGRLRLELEDLVTGERLTRARSR